MTCDVSERSRGSLSSIWSTDQLATLGAICFSVNTYLQKLVAWLLWDPLERLAKGCSGQGQRLGTRSLTSLLFSFAPDSQTRWAKPSKASSSLSPGRVWHLLLSLSHTLCAQSSRAVSLWSTCISGGRCSGGKWTGQASRKERKLPRITGSCVLLCIGQLFSANSLSVLQTAFVR